MKTFKEMREGKADKESEMFAWILDKIENSDDTHSKMKKEFAKKFGNASAKKHWDDMVTNAMEG
jgi:hypothetical protein